MPKLDSATAARVDENDSSTFDALPEDTYVAVLREVEVKPGKKADYWSWQFDVAEGEFENRKLWANTSLSEAADWKMQEMFKAFGVPTDTDTDELIGQVVRLVVTQREIETGARTGQIGNNVDTVLPYDGADNGEEPF